MSKPSKEEFFRDISNYVFISNHIYRRDYDNPTKLNNSKISKDVFKSKFNFTDRDYEALPELDGFICEPEHLAYRQIYGGKWNTYSPIRINPKPGEFPYIKRLIEHLYGANEVESLDQVEELYDYHTILLKYPKAKQQGRILYSHGQGTSKSALAELETLIFGDNLSKIRDNEFESTFNSIWVSSLILWLDEPNFDNPKKMSRQIRDLITSSVMNLRKMQTDYEKTGFFAKMLITTNDSNFMPIEKGDRRYWIRETSKVKNEEPNYMEKVKAEIDHYVYFLLNREMKYPQKQDKTFWLPSSILNTNGFKKMVGDNTTQVEKAVVEVLEQWFIKNDKAQSVNFRLMDIKDAVAFELGLKADRIPDLDVVITLRDFLGITQPDKNSRPRKGDHVLSGMSEKAVGKWWTCDRNNSNLDTNVDIFDIERIAI